MRHDHQHKPGTLRTIHCIIGSMLQRGDGSMDWASDYCEPGYTQPERGILFGNWNSQWVPDPDSPCAFRPEDMEDPPAWLKVPRPRNGAMCVTHGKPAGHYPGDSYHCAGGMCRDEAMPRLAEAAEAAGYAIEWSDEWDRCECGKAFRTSGDSFDWTPAFRWDSDCTISCMDCITDNPADYLATIEGDPDKWDDIPEGIDPAEHGYVLFREEESCRYRHGDMARQWADDMREAPHHADRFVLTADGDILRMYVHQEEWAVARAHMVASEGWTYAGERGIPEDMHEDRQEGIPSHMLGGMSRVEWEEALAPIPPCLPAPAACGCSWCVSGVQSDTLWTLHATRHPMACMGSESAYGHTTIGYSVAGLVSLDVHAYLPSWIQGGLEGMSWPPARVRVTIAIAGCDPIYL